MRVGRKGEERTERAWLWDKYANSSMLGLRNLRVSALGLLSLTACCAMSINRVGKAIRRSRFGWVPFSAHGHLREDGFLGWGVHSFGRMSC